MGEAFVRMAPQLRAAFVEGQLLPFAAEKTRMESAAGAAWQDVVLVCIPAISCKVLLDLVRCSAGMGRGSHRRGGKSKSARGRGKRTGLQKEKSRRKGRLEQAS